LSGAKLREYHLAKALGTQGWLHYVFFSAANGVVPSGSDLPFCGGITPVAPAKLYGKANLIRGVMGRWPLPVLNYTSQEMTDVLQKVARSRQFQIVQLDSIHLAPYEALLRRLLPQARIVYDWHNIESDILRQYAKRGPTLARRRYAAITARKMAQLESKILHSAHGHIVCSDRERERLLQLAPQARVEVIENGVDVHRFPATFRAGPERRRLVFVGLMNYHANVDAAVWFTERIWPALRRQFPQLTLTLVGAEPSPEVMELAKQERVEVTGTVPDVAPYYAEAVAALVPLRSGGGTRLKILESMAAGVPVISTRIGAEGLEVTPGQDILLAPAEDGPELEQQWSAAVQSIVTDPGLWLQMARAGRQRVEGQYDWGVLGTRLVETYRRWII
jgi:glycosyltransferase involved in cell wall biosynthesis